MLSLPLRALKKRLEQGVDFIDALLQAFFQCFVDSNL